MVNASDCMDSWMILNMICSYSLFRFISFCFISSGVLHSCPGCLVLPVTLLPWSPKQYGQMTPFQFPNIIPMKSQVSGDISLNIMVCINFLSWFLFLFYVYFFFSFFTLMVFCVYVKALNLIIFMKFLSVKMS